MNPEVMLSQLEPLRSPEAIGWWPPAMGWWFVFSILLISMVYLTLWLIKRHRQGSYRRKARKQLQSLRANQATTAQINTLLKSVAIRAFPAETVASLHGEDWARFLTSTCRKVSKDGIEGLSNIYIPNPDPANDMLFTLADEWIRFHEISRA